jgi:hypothetical protein
VREFVREQPPQLPVPNTGHLTYRDYFAIFHQKYVCVRTCVKVDALLADGLPTRWLPMSVAWPAPLAGSI